MADERRVRLFKNGRNQAVRIPREFELPGQEAMMRKENGRLVLEPAAPQTLVAFLDSLEPWEERLPEIHDPPPEPVDV